MSYISSLATRVTRPLQLRGVSRLRFAKQFERALGRGEKSHTRRPITAHNARVVGMDLQLHELQLNYARLKLGFVLRAPMVATPRRYASVLSCYAKGHLFWVAIGAATRFTSDVTLQVISALPVRLRDLTADQARAEGFDDVASFGRWWDAQYGAGAWSQNPWVWDYHFKVFHRNVSLVRNERDLDP